MEAAQLIRMSSRSAITRSGEAEMPTSGLGEALVANDGVLP